MTTSALTTLMLISGRAGGGVAGAGVAAGTVAAGRGAAAWVSAGRVSAGGVWVAGRSAATVGGDGSVLFAGGWSSAPQKKTGATASAHARARALRNVVFIGFHFSSFRAHSGHSSRRLFNVAKARAERLAASHFESLRLRPFREVASSVHNRD